MTEAAARAAADRGLVDPPPPPFTPFERKELAAALEAELRRHVLDAWFPRCVDRDRGGFLCDFDRRWRPAGPQRRMLEFQARQTRVAAALSVAFPREDRWPEIALHGFRFLRASCDRKSATSV